LTVDTILIDLLALAALFLFLAAGMPIAVVLGGTCYVWTTMPLFVPVGNLAAEFGITDDLFRCANLILRRIRGGMYLAVAASSAPFSRRRQARKIRR